MAGHANVIQPWYPEYAGLAQRAPASSAYTADLNRFGYAKYRKLKSAVGPVDVLFLHGVSIIIHRSLVDELGYVFDPEFFAYAEDMDLGLRIRALGYRCVVVPAAVVYHKHRLKTDLSWATFVKTVRIIRNRYLAFYKVMALPEFALMSALLTLGSPLNAGEFGLRLVPRIIYGIGLLPVTLVSFWVTLWHLPRFAAKRREVRARTARPGAWCLRAVWHGVDAPDSLKTASQPDSST
jgi:GT2 family glycosyltransferase